MIDKNTEIIALRRAIDAINNNNVDVIREYIDDGFDLNLRFHSADDHTLINKAMKLKRYEIAILLAKAGANINIVGRDTYNNKYFPLTYAIIYNEPKMIKYLINEELINNNDFRGLGAFLYDDYSYKFKDAIIELIKVGKSFKNNKGVNFLDAYSNVPRNKSSLFIAIDKKMFDIAELLIESGADINNYKDNILVSLMINNAPIELYEAVMNNINFTVDDNDKKDIIERINYRINHGIYVNLFNQLLNMIIGLKTRDR